MSNKISFSEKYYKCFIGYVDDYKIKPFSIILPRTSVHVKRYDGETKWMNFFDWSWWFIKKHNDIWNKVSNSIKKEFDSEPIYSKKNSENQYEIMNLQIFTIKKFQR